MKRILLLAVTISLFGNITAQNNTWKVYLQGQAVKSIDFDNDYVWAATDNFLVRLNKTDLSTTYYSYPYTDENDSYYKLIIDKNGVIWLARSEHDPMTSNLNRWSTIYSFDGNQWKEVKVLGNGTVSSMALDKNNNKWIATYGYNGLYKIERYSCTQYTPENSGLIYYYVADVGSDNDGNIWMLNYEPTGFIEANLALIKYDGDDWISHYSAEDVYGVTMYIDNQGNPWLQSLNLLRKLDTISNTWTESIDLNNLPWTSLTSLMTFEGENKLWFNTAEYNEVDGWMDTGIAVYDGSDWSHYSTSNSELPSDTVYQIAVDPNGTKWIGTNNGLVAFNENGLLSTSDYSELMNDIVLYPNPANDFITLNMPVGLHNATVNIFDIQGKKIKTYSINNNRNRLDVSAFPSGIYFVNIQANENHFTKKFIKQ